MTKHTSARSATKTTFRNPRVLGQVAVALLATLAASSAFGQEVTGEVSAQRFDPAPGPRNFITTRSARTDGEKAWTAGAMLNYAYKPLEITRCNAPEGAEDPNSCEGATSEREVPVVENMFTGELIGSYTIIPQLQLGLRLPVTWSKGLGREGTQESEQIDAVGMGDPMFEVKGRLYGNADSPIAAGLTGYATAPLGHLTAEDSYIGDSSPSIGGRAIVDGLSGPFTWGINLGGVWREAAQFGETELGAEGRFGAAVGYAFSPILRGVVDTFGFTNFTGKGGTTGVEVDGGLQFTPLGSPITVHFGGGGGALRATGIPHFRAFLGVIYSSEVKDRDLDGIDDGADQCPTEPEDMDGTEDSDGCPDLDNDLDNVPDNVDKCPKQAEDVDGFEDSDGCPEGDNDKDGVDDTADSCPAQPETKNGFKDEDGCPDEPDSDSDGVADKSDKCPNEPEDTDGFQDTDGCPDPDNDNDGVPDVQDECIDEPETKNDFEDTDGCPDEAKGKKGAKKPAAKPAP